MEQHAAYVSLGSRQLSEQFCQMSDSIRLAGVHTEIFKTPSMNGSFAQEQTLAKDGATKELRTGHSYGFASSWRISHDNSLSDRIQNLLRYSRAMCWMYISLLNISGFRSNISVKNSRLDRVSSCASLEYGLRRRPISKADQSAFVCFQKDKRGRACSAIFQSPDFGCHPKCYGRCGISGAWPEIVLFIQK